MAKNSTTAKKKTKKAEPLVEPEVTEEELDDLADGEDFDEVEEDEVSPKAPKKQAGSKKGKVGGNITFGMIHLAEHLSKQAGKEVTTRELRGLTRRMARDGSKRVDREIVAGNRTQYDWPLGLKDPEVQAIITAFNGGEADVEKAEKLAALKEQGAKKKRAKQEAAETPVTKKKKAKKAPEPIEEVEEEIDEDLDLDEDEDDNEE